MQDARAFDDKLKAFPGVLSAARSRIAGLIDQNSLHNMKVKPYDSLEQASAAAGSMEAPLHSGDMDEVRRIGADMDALLTEAVAMTERQAMIRQNNLRDLETVRSTWATLSQRRNELQSRLAGAKNRFARQHLDALEKLLEEAGGALRQGAAEVPQLETWTSDARGEYDNARSGLDRLLALQDETANSMNSISSSLDSLEERLDSLNRLFTEGQSRVDAAYNLLHSRGIASQNRFQLSLLPEYTELEQRLASGPYDLDQLEETGRSYAAPDRFLRRRSEPAGPPEGRGRTRSPNGHAAGTAAPGTGPQTQFRPTGRRVRRRGTFLRRLFLGRRRGRRAFLRRLFVWRRQIRPKLRRLQVVSGSLPLQHILTLTVGMM